MLAENDLFVTAVFEDNSRKRYRVSNDINAESMIKLIMQDQTIAKPSHNMCLVKEGHILEKDEKISSGSNSKEFSMNIVFNPFYGSPRTPSSTFAAFYGFNDDFDDGTVVLDERTVDDLAELFPHLFGRNDNVYRICGFIALKKFIIGLIVGSLTGPLALVALPCYDFDVSGILGMSFGVIIWVLVFLFIATGRKSRRR